LESEEVVKPRILVLDIETKPVIAYTWSLFDLRVGLDQIIETGGLLCFAAKWLGETDVHFYCEWEHGKEAMVLAIHKLLTEADAVITYNGDKFDIPKLMAEFILAGLDAPPPITSIDVYKTVRAHLGFTSKKLDFVAKALGSKGKHKHGGFVLWRKVMEGDAEARREMKTYNIGDIDELEFVYNKVRPFIKNHPHMSTVKSIECGACGSDKTQSRGWRRTKAMRIQRLHCQDCGSWRDGKREKV
jgi:hypothetical protein